MRVEEFLDGKVKLILAKNTDCEIEADGIVTDPPYGISLKKGKGKLTGGREKKTIGLSSSRHNRTIYGDDEPFDPMRWMTYPCVAFTGAQHFYSRLPAGGMLHCWDKRGNYKPVDQADADVIYVSKPHKEAKHSRVLHLVWRGLIKDTERLIENLHPTQKPVELMRWIIDLCDIPVGGTIYDPYMGSGTTGVAAVKCGYKFVGVEMIEEYFDAACRRFSGEKLGTDVVPLPPTFSLFRRK